MIKLKDKIRKSFYCMLTRTLRKVKNARAEVMLGYTSQELYNFKNALTIIETVMFDLHGKSIPLL
jgi:hypothetical protein